jgi:Holliday junction resolvase RusA-like endonuclease
MLLVDCFRAGRPRTKGSLRAYCTKGRGHVVRYQESVEESSHWRAQVAKAAQVDMLVRHGKLINTSEPVTAWLRFYFEQENIPSHRTPYPTDIHLGDTDKLVRNVLDALTDAHVIKDDSLVVHVDTMKLWTPSGLTPGVQVVVCSVEAGWLPGVGL